MVITIDSNSFGKDSLAMIIERAKRGLIQPQDIILYSEVWATPTMQAELPVMVDFINKAEEILKSRYGLTVTHIRQTYSFEENLYQKKIKGKNLGNIYGIPFNRSPWCTANLKRAPLQKFKNSFKKKGDIVIENIGYAADEPKRFSRLKENQRAPLVEFDITERMAYDICKKEDLLSPIYRDSTMRGGCWFCPNQRKAELKLLRLNYPDRFEMLMKWEKDTMEAYNSYKKPCFGSKTLEERNKMWEKESHFCQESLF